MNDWIRINSTTTIISNDENDDVELEYLLKGVETGISKNSKSICIGLREKIIKIQMDTI